MAGRAEKVFMLLLRLGVAGVFLSAGAIKAFDPAYFATQVNNYRLLPYAVSCAVGVYLPWLEIAGGAALALGIWRAGATFLLGGMLVVFFIALTSAWARGLDIECGCFGHATHKSNYPLSLLIETSLFAALCIAIRRPK